MEAIRSLESLELTRRYVESIQEFSRIGQNFQDREVGSAKKFIANRHFRSGLSKLMRLQTIQGLAQISLASQIEPENDRYSQTREFILDNLFFQEIVRRQGLLYQMEAFYPLY